MSPDRDTAGVDRASRKLAIEASGTGASAIGDLSSARARLAEVTAQLAADPGAALKAHARISPQTIEAATARPAA